MLNNLTIRSTILAVMQKIVLLVIRLVRMWLSATSAVKRRRVSLHHTADGASTMSTEAQLHEMPLL